jgi:hypothetical protein
MGLKGVAVLNEQGWSGSVLREPARARGGGWRQQQRRLIAPHVSARSMLNSTSGTLEICGHGNSGLVVRIECRERY